MPQVPAPLRAQAKVSIEYKKFELHTASRIAAFLDMRLADDANEGIDIFI